jgi:hypothetical protein
MRTARSDTEGATSRWRRMSARAEPGAQTKPRRCERRGPSGRRRYARNNGAPVEFELARFCVPPFGSARVAYSPPRPRAGGFRNCEFDQRIRPHIPDMIRIAITPAAFDAVAATLVLGTVAVEPERDEDGSVHIWLDPRVLEHRTVRLNRRGFRRG